MFSGSEKELKTHQVCEQSTGKCTAVWSCSHSSWSLRWPVHIVITHLPALEPWMHIVGALVQWSTPEAFSSTRVKTISTHRWGMSNRSTIHAKARIIFIWLVVFIFGIPIFVVLIVRERTTMTRKLPRKPWVGKTRTWKMCDLFKAAA